MVGGVEQGKEAAKVPVNTIIQVRERGKESTTEVIAEVTSREQPGIEIGSDPKAVDNNIHAIPSAGQVDQEGLRAAVFVRKTTSPNIVGSQSVVPIRHHLTIRPVAAQQAQLPQKHKIRCTLPLENEE